jgi:hypothetical protein
MIPYLVKMAAIGAAFAASLWVAPLPDTERMATPTHGYTVEGLPTARIAPPEAATSPVAAPKPATPTTAAPPARTCPEWAEYGRRFGWPETELTTLAVIMRRESACTTGAVGDGGDSRGLLQIHCPTWVAKSRYWPNGWAAAHGFNVTCDDLNHPDTNLAIGFLIWAGVEGSAGGWGNWSTWRP